MYLEASWSFDDFLRAAGQRLNMSTGQAKRAFHSNGAYEIYLLYEMIKLF
jgi:hypothetical protein